MLKSQPIIAFVATMKPERARKFYANTLGLKLVSEDGFALAFDAGGTMLRVAIVPRLVPAGYTVLGWIVPNIRQTATKLTRRGIIFKRYEGMPQDELGIWTAPGGAKIAWFEDPDGNTLSLTEIEDRAKARKSTRLKSPKSTRRRAVKRRSR